MKPFTNLALKNLFSALADREFAFFETTRFNAHNYCSLLFVDPLERLICTAGQGGEKFLSQVQARLDEGYFAAGWFAYEFGYLLEPVLFDTFRPAADTVLADLAFFKVPSVFDHRQGELHTGQWPLASPATNDQLNICQLSNLSFSEDKKKYLQKIRRIKEYIAAGDTYQVNYTLKLLFDFKGSADELYQRLRRNQSVSYGVSIRAGEQRIHSFSPELFFRKEGEICTVRPMKGTSRRGRTLAEDKEVAAHLRADIKNLSENVMIVDLLRNDLGRLSRRGSVAVQSLFDVETYETLHQMTSTVSGVVPGSVTLPELFKALFPCGSVTGAPKIRTMEIIHELESSCRGVYTGAIGYLTPSGDACFNVPIRTVILENGKGEMGIGSGIVFDSDPEQEWQECQLKGDFLTKPLPEFQLIETILWLPEQGFWLLDFHLDRLVSSARYFLFQMELTQVGRALEELASGFIGKSPQRVRLLLHKDGDFETTVTPCDPPQSISFSDFRQNDLPRVQISEKKTDSSQITIFHKTTLRQFYNTERGRAINNGLYEVIFCNEKNEVTEGAITTLFIRKNGMYYTPPVNSGLLDGVMRRFLLKKYGERAREKVLGKHDLLDADALYVVNSVRGVVQVVLVS